MPNDKKVRVAVLGAGNMGTAVAQVVASNGFSVSLWNHAGDLLPLHQIDKSGENKKYLKGIKLSRNIFTEPDMEKAVSLADVVFLVVPSFCVGAVVKQMSNFIRPGVVCVDVSKGLVEKPIGLVTDMIFSNLPASCKKKLVTISGPAIARDMASGSFTAMNIASKSLVSVSLVKSVMENDNLKLIVSNDLVGVELAGSFKNAYAIVFGMCEGLNLLMNTKAALLVYALGELDNLIVKMGGKGGTVYGLAGLGDLVGTGFCVQSRNHRFGMYLAKGLSVEKSLKKVGQVVEGKSAVMLLCSLARKYGVNVPLANMINRISSGKSNNVQKELNKYLAKL